MATSSLDRKALRDLLRQQDGLVTARQAIGVGLTSSALSRRAGSGLLRRVLPLVYAEGAADLTRPQRARAALLFAGADACMSGEAALLHRRIGHLPHEVTAETVDVLVPHARRLRSADWVRVTHTKRMPHRGLVDGLPTAPVGRAVADAARWQTSYDVVLAIASCAINAGRTTLADLQEELAASPVRGSRLLRQVIAESESGVRSVAEAKALRLLRAAGLPEPLVNEPIEVAGEIFVPDLRWGRVILEIDSRAYHLLEAGAWERTLARRAKLRAAGYDVLSYTPEQIRETPDLVIAGVVEALAMAAAA
jgi:hypothetical protein